MRSVGVRAGQFKVPYGLQRRTWSGELEFVTISAAMRSFSLERDIGLTVLGRPLAGRLHYELAVLNGDGRPGARTTTSISRTRHGWSRRRSDRCRRARATSSTTRARCCIVGVAGYYNLVPTDIRLRTNNPAANIDQNNDGRVDNVAIWQGGVELRALWRGAALQAEWFGRVEDPGVHRGRRATTGVATCRRATSYCRRGCRSRAASAARTFPSTARTSDEHLRRGTRIDEQSVAVSSYFARPPDQAAGRLQPPAGRDRAGRHVGPRNPPRARRGPAGVLTGTNLRAAGRV